MSALDDQELATLLADLESDRVERKASASDREEIKKGLCAFANDLPHHRKPGVIFIGVHDDGTSAGLEVTDKLLRDLTGIRGEGNLVPLPTMTVQKRPLRGMDLAVVVVEPADAPPVRLRGRAWIRVGPRRDVATPEEESRLTERRQARDLAFELRPVSGAKNDDLDLDLFEKTYLPAAIAPDVLAQNQRSRTQQLQSLRFLSLDPEPAPTALGLLVIGREPNMFVGGAYVQFVRFAGTDMVSPMLDQKEVHGPLTVLIPALDDLMRLSTAVALDVAAGPVDVKRPDYPLAALQQIVRNAILHRRYDGTNAPVQLYWFADRVEVRSPGGLYGQVTPENFGEPGVVAYRNLHLTEAMKSLGFVQRFGYGIALARAELEKNGNPPLELRPTPTHVFVTLRRRP